jgi:hypothetical protein
MTFGRRGVLGHGPAAGTPAIGLLRTVAAEAPRPQRCCREGIESFHPEEESPKLLAVGCLGTTGRNAHKCRYGRLSLLHTLLVEKSVAGQTRFTRGCGHDVITPSFSPVPPAKTLGKNGRQEFGSVLMVKVALARTPSTRLN